MSENGDRPDSSTTKRAKPAVLLMQLLSRPDDGLDDDDDDVVGGSTGSSSNDTSTTNNDMSTTIASPPPAGGGATVNQAGRTPQSSVDKLLDSVFDGQDNIQAPSSEDGSSEQPTRNNLLRVFRVTYLLPCARLILYHRYCVVRRTDTYSGGGTPCRQFLLSQWRYAVHNWEIHRVTRMPNCYARDALLELNRQINLFD